MAKQRENFDAVNSMTLRKWQNKKDRLEAEVEQSKETMTNTLGRIFKNTEIKRAIQSERNSSIRRVESGALSPLEKAIISAAQHGGEIGFAGLESSYIDYNDVANKPWEKD